MKRNIVVVFSFFFLFSFSAVPREVRAGEPTDQVKPTVDAVLEVLKDRELKKPERTRQRREKIRALVSERFDFEEMAKRSLALHWKGRTPEEQKEFVSLYTDLLESTYIKKIERYENEKILYLDEKIEGAYAQVKTAVVTSKEVEIPIVYRLTQRGKKWMVYDVIVEGVSLVNNYRTQFNSIIRSHSYEELVKRVRNKTLKEPS